MTTSRKDPTIDFEAINKASKPHILDLARELDNEVEQEGSEVKLRNPHRADTHTGSFSINCQTGLWADFATQDRGSDVVSFWAFCTRQSQVEAARDLASRYMPGSIPVIGSQSAPRLPAPADAPEPDFHGYTKRGETFKNAWCYRDRVGVRLGYAMRFEGANGKQVRPLRWSGARWESKAFSTPRPLFNLHKLSERPGAEVLVCEGEKAADAASILFPELVCVTSPGGAQSAAKADWAPLQGREVIIWPDHDRPGLKYADDVARLAHHAGALKIRVVGVPEGLPEGWDVADSPPPHIDIHALLRDAKPVDVGILGERGRITVETAETARDVPTIRLTHESEVTENALKALVPHRDFFQRAGVLVRIIPGDAGPASLAPVHTPWLRETLSRRARFVKDSGPRLVPEWVSSMILDRRIWPEVPEIRGLVTVPVFLGDGRVLADPGIDLASGLYFAPSRQGHVETIKNPSKVDAEAARDALFEVVEDFPFAASPSPACHRAAWLAFLLTVVGRFAIDGPVPFGLFDAPSQASGKGLLVKVTSLIALGGIGPATAASGDEEEFRKALLPILESGDRIGWLDDVSNPFGGRIWNALLTAWPEYRDRILGKSEVRRVPALAVWAVTGNNLSLRGDSTRRALHIRIEPTCERPEDRADWHHADLLGWARQNQARLLTAALTILSAYHLAGRPSSGLPALGSFEEWSCLIRDSVYWITGEDVSATQRDLGAVADETRSALRDFFAGIKATFGCNAFSAGELMAKIAFRNSNISTLQPGREIADVEILAAAKLGAEALKRGPGELNDKSLGTILKRHRGVIVDGLRLDGTAGNRRTSYRLTNIAVSAVVAVSKPQYSEKLCREISVEKLPRDFGKRTG